MGKNKDLKATKKGRSDIHESFMTSHKAKENNRPAEFTPDQARIAAQFLIAMATPVECPLSRGEMTKIANGNFHANRDQARKLAAVVSTVDGWALPEA